MKKGNLFILTAMMIAALFSSCFEDAADTPNPTTLNVTVNLDSDVWGYPMDSGNGTDYLAYAGDSLYTWQYSEVGTDAITDITEYEDPTDDTTYNFGYKSIIIYLCSALTANAKDLAVLYSEESATYTSGSSATKTITLSDIAAGDYYVIAFYDYRSGGNLTNLLNRYDRYALYAETANALSGNSTPFIDKADIVSVLENEEKSVSLTIDRDWVLGKPANSTGRNFLNSTTDTIPTPD